jgi:hypothetical protein
MTTVLCAGALLMTGVACSDDEDPTASEDTSKTTAPEDDGSTTLARGADVELVGDGIGSQTLNITAEQADGEVTGEFRLNEVVVTLQCANTDTDGIVILGGEVTTPDSDDPEMMGQLMALIIREGDPDSVSLVGNSGTGSCTALLESIPEDGLTDDSLFNDVDAGSDIETIGA